MQEVKNTHLTINAIVSWEAGVLSSDMDASRVIIPYTLMNRMVISYKHSGHRVVQRDDTVHYHKATKSSLLEQQVSLDHKLSQS